MKSRSILELPIPLLLALAFAASAAMAAAPAPTRPAEASGRAELVPWDQEGDFASVLARAKKARKLVFIDFYATWCGPCKMMDRTVYTDSTVARAAARYVNRKVDAEKGEGILLAQRYHIDAYPTLVIVDPTGKEMARETGYRPADRFRRYLDDTRTGRGTAAGIEALIARRGGDTFENRVALGEKYADAREFEKARDQRDRALALDPSDPEGRASALWLTEMHGDATREPGAAVADARAFLARFPAHPRRAEALELKAAAHAAGGEKDSAVATQRLLLDARPDDAAALASFARFCALNGLALDEALQAANRAVELSGGKDPSTLDALAEVYSARGQFDEAVATAERALDASPNQGYLRGRLERFQELAVEAVRARSR